MSITCSVLSAPTGCTATLQAGGSLAANTIIINEIKSRQTLLLTLLYTRPDVIYYQQAISGKITTTAVTGNIEVINVDGILNSTAISGNIENSEITGTVENSQILGNM